MEYHYANVVQFTLMECDVRLAFGDQKPGGEVVPGTDIILHPVVANRLLYVLAALISQYEKAHGEISFPPLQDPQKEHAYG